MKTFGMHSLECSAKVLQFHDCRNTSGLLNTKTGIYFDINQNSRRTSAVILLTTILFQTTPHPSYLRRGNKHLFTSKHYVIPCEKEREKQGVE